jgi:hypothetical protein
MKEPYRKGIANHPGPESCEGSREAALEALTGVQAGWVSSREIDLFQGADDVRQSGRQYGGRQYRETPSPCVVGDPRHAWKLYAREPGHPSSARRVRSGGPEGERDER